MSAGVFEGRVVRATGAGITGGLQHLTRMPEIEPSLQPPKFFLFLKKL